MSPADPAPTSGRVTTGPIDIIDIVDRLSRDSTPASGSGSDSDSDSEDDNPPALRDYQQQAVNAVLKAIRDGIRRIGVSAPTGGGKTIIFASIIKEVLTKHRKGKVLILVGTEEQAHQAKNKVLDAYGRERILIGEERNSIRASPRDEVVIAMYQTLKGYHRMEEFKKKFRMSDFKLVVVDEAHHSVSNSHLQILSEFNNEVQVKSGTARYRAPSHGRKIPIVGVSATFTRHDSRELIWVYEKVVYACSLQELLDAGHLVPIQIWKLSQEPRDSDGAHGTLVKVKESLVPPSNRRRRAVTEGPPALRSLTFDEISAFAGTQKFNQQVVQYYRTKARGRKSTLIFAKDLKYVDNLTKVFVDAGIPAKSVTSRTSKNARQDYIASFARGECPVMITCLALSEGFDAPQIDCLILANPTDSRIFHTQMVGRATRLSPKTGKIDCLILDLVGNCDRFPLGVEPMLERVKREKMEIDQEG